ncbi:hypothetical protein Agabi119p4_4179 [Agaricus bisporus var. burnettii]|uniref:Uncharacterized protein n=1 Tax=Agaricus bisporus var. burnettii TaxID=192524 RepID=A0A8H7KH06_AGABI|nr:hypothetical protein Agabi119p4_4179 [Agaricus bisporus var. burnettii]
MATRSNETPTRPRPPAKVRRSLAKRSTTPPPAYASTFPFPSDNHGMQTINAANSWGGEDTPSEENDDDLSWLNEKSKDELTDLLVKADTLIKERENELSLTSAACKALYDNNVALKNKHEAFFDRVPLNQSSISSPNVSPHISFSPLQPSSLTRSTSTIESPTEHVLPRTYALRRGTMPMIDISFLADQNAELLSKLEKLEAEASSADVTGRRELRRLEKDIRLLKEDLEKTQAKSNELEEKAKSGFGLGAEKVIEEAWKRKKERQQKLNTLRSAGRVVRSTPPNFAPDAPSLFSSGSHSSPDLSTLEEITDSGESTMTEQPERSTIQPDQQLIAKLLEKIQELETTNGKILEHQTETATRLQAVQRETEFITRVYERLNQDEGQHGFDEAEARDQPSDLANKFGRSHRTLPSQLLSAKVKRQRSFHKNDSRSRGSLMGLFDDPPPNTSTPQKHKKYSLPIPFSESSWHRPRHQSAYSMSNGGLASPALSILSLYSPPPRHGDDVISNIAVGPSLAKELGDSWDAGDSTNTTRPRSLSDVSVFSGSPCSHSQALSIEHEDRDASLHPSTVPTNSLQLSIEPPTPHKMGSLTKHQESLLIGNMSPRFRVARSLRAHNYRYTEGRYPEPMGSLHRQIKFVADDSSPTPTRGPSGGPLFAEAFQVMMDEFDDTGARLESQVTDDSRSPSPDDDKYTDAKEALDEADEENSSANVSMDSGTSENAHRFYEGTPSSTIVSQRGKATQSRFGGIMVEVWMWLQFVMIMFVFVWVMARRGPKSVLKEAERKRTLSIKKRA